MSSNFSSVASDSVSLGSSPSSPATYKPLIFKGFFVSQCSSKSPVNQFSYYFFVFPKRKNKIPDKNHLFFTFRYSGKMGKKGIKKSLSGGFPDFAFSFMKRKFREILEISFQTHTKPPISKNYRGGRKMNDRPLLVRYNRLE